MNDKDFKLLKKIKKKFRDFFTDYQNNLWSSKQYCFKKDITVLMITKLDLIYYFNLKITLKKLNELLEFDEELKTQLNEFINNNFIHYASSMKLKDLLQEYKESNVLFEQNEFHIDYSKLELLNDFARVQTKESLGLDLDSDVDEQQKNKILENVEKFN